MLIIALVLAIIGLAALVTAVVTSNELIAWVCIGASVLGVLLLIVDAVRDRTRRDTAAPDEPDEPDEPQEVGQAGDFDANYPDDTDTATDADTATDTDTATDADSSDEPATADEATAAEDTADDTAEERGPR